MLPATVNTDAPSARRSSGGTSAGSSMGVSRTDRATASSTTDAATSRASAGMNVGAAQLPLGLGPQMPDTARSPDAPPPRPAPGPPSAPATPAWQPASAWRRASTPDRSSRRSAPVRRACRLLRPATPRAARRGCGVRACASRVSSVACCASCSISTRPGGRAVITGEVGGELGLPDVDDQPPSRPALVQPRINADDLPDRPFRPVAAGPFGEPHPKDRGEVVLQRGVVGLRRRDLRGVQDATVDRQPPAVQGLHLVRDRDMGVQVRVPGAGVAVGERGGDQPGDVHLTYPARTLPGIQRVILEEAQRGRDCGMMGLLDLRGDRRGRRSPTALTPTSPARTSGRTPRPPPARAGTSGPALRPAPGHPSGHVPPAAGTIRPPAPRAAARVPPLAGRHGEEGPGLCCGRRTGPAAPPGTAAPRSTAGTGHRAPAPDHCLATFRRAGGGPRRTAAASAPRSPHPRRRGRRRRPTRGRPTDPAPHHAPSNSSPDPSGPDASHPAPPPDGSDSHSRAPPTTCASSSSHQPKAPRGRPTVTYPAPRAPGVFACALRGERSRCTG